MNDTTEIHHTIRVECDNCGGYYHGRRMPAAGQTRTIRANTCILCRATNGAAPTRQAATGGNQHPPRRHGLIQVA